MKYGPNHVAVSRYVEEAKNINYLSECGAPYSEDAIQSFSVISDFDEVLRLHQKIQNDAIPYEPIDIELYNAYRSTCSDPRKGLIPSVKNIFGIGMFPFACHYVERDLSNIVVKKLCACVKGIYQENELGFDFIERLMVIGGRLTVIDRLSEFPIIGKFMDIVRKGYLPVALEHNNVGTKITIH